MQVIATAGHVDHGKSTLVRALTGQEPDRLAEEHRRGLSIELGYCWTTVPGAGDVAFVDVPGHERFLSTMLAGVGPVPAVLFVVAADDPWMPQAAEHLSALDAFRVRHGVVAVTRSDLCSPAPAMAEVARRLASTSLAGSPVVAVSGLRGDGLDELRRLLADLVADLPPPDPRADVRLWVDRRFSVAGAGAVVTGTLPAGRIAVGDELQHDDQVFKVRGLESLGAATDQVLGVSRVALRLGGDISPAVRRGSALTTPKAWRTTRVFDVRVDDPEQASDSPTVHIGSAAVAGRWRALGDALGRLTLTTPLPLRVGDRLVLRDAGSRRLTGAVVLDPSPPGLSRRGAAATRAADLSTSIGNPDLSDELRRRGWASSSELRAIGVPLDAAEEVAVEAHGWLLDRALLPELSTRLRQLLEERRASHPLDPNVSTNVAARSLGLPDPELVHHLVAPPLGIDHGQVTFADAALPTGLLAALTAVESELAAAPFAAPTAERLMELGLDPRALAAAERAGRVLRLAPGIVLLPGADLAAVGLLGELPQPFTTSQARTRLATSRRVVLPLLAHLDARRLTRRLPDDRREVVRRQ